MESIYKYAIAIDSISLVAMPADAKVLTVQMQGDKPFIWAVVENSNPITDYEFELYGTGHVLQVLPDSVEREYIGTFQVNNGQYVFHLFMIKSIQP